MEKIARSLKLTLYLLCFLAGPLQLFTQQAQAARNSRIDEASVPEPGRIIIEYGQDAFEETSGLKTGRDVATYFNLGYALSDRLEVRARLLKNDLSGATIVFNPLFNGLTSANGWGIEFKIELDEVKAVLPTKETPQFQPGSAFSGGIGVNSLYLQSSTVDTSMNSVSGFILYSTDFTPEFRAHTLFALSHFTSDFRRGTSTTIGIGGDYDLLRFGRNGKLQLTANGLIDILSIRKPSFDTGRITRFDAGLRIVAANDFSGYAGYAVVNDSLSDKNSQGFFYGIAITPSLKPTRAERPKEEAQEVEEQKPTSEQEAEVAEQAQAAEQPSDTGTSAQEGASETKGVSSIGAGTQKSEGLGTSQVFSAGVQSSIMTGNTSLAPEDIYEATEKSERSSLMPTTSERIVRPPAIEKPWELLPIGYDFHPIATNPKNGKARISEQNNLKVEESKTSNEKEAKLERESFKIHSNS